MRSLLTLVLATLLVQSCFAKSNELEKAEYLYTHFAFHEAIPYYKTIAANSTDPALLSQLGDCYRFTGNMEKAATWYARAVAFNDCKDIVKLHYGQVLMQLMQYEEAGKWLQEYQKTNSNDKRVGNLFAGTKIAKQLLASPRSGDASYLSFNSDHSEFAPTLWKGNLVFTADTAIAVNKKTDKWSGNAFYSIYSVSCDGKGNCASDMKTVKAGKEANIKYHTGPCTFSADGSKMYLTRTRYRKQFLSNLPKRSKDGEVMLEILIASDYDEQEKRFKTTEPFPYNSSDYSVSSATVSPDGTRLVFSSDMPGGVGGADLYICYSDGAGGWAKPENMGSTVNTEGEEVFPFFVDDNTLSFSSDGQVGIGGLDIYTARWNQKTRQFSAPENAGVPINSSYDDITLALMPGKESAYFSSNRPSVTQGDNIFYYEKYKKPPVDQKQPDTAIVKNKDTDKVLPVASVSPVKRTADPAENEEAIAAKPAGTKPLPAQTVAPARPKDKLAKEEKPVAAKPAPSTNEAYKDLAIGKVYPIQGFYFGFNKADILANATDKLGDLLALMNEHPGLKIQVQAYSDCRGTAEINHRISLQRAISVRRFLEAKGIAASRISCRGFGITHPEVVCSPCGSCTDDQHQRNRRIEFRVTGL